MRDFAAARVHGQCTGAAPAWRGIGVPRPALKRKISRKSPLLSDGTRLSSVGGPVRSPTPIRRRGSIYTKVKDDAGTLFLLRKAGEGDHATHGGGGMRAPGIDGSWCGCSKRRFCPLRLVLLATSPAKRGRNRHPAAAES